MSASRVTQILIAIVLTLVVLAFGIYLGGHSDRLPSFVRDPLVGDHDEQVVHDAFDRIEKTYYRKPKGTALADAAIAGMVASLRDRFSNYFSEAEYRQFVQGQHHSFSGIGTAVAADPRGLRIVTVYPGSPAAAAHLRPGDVVVAVGGHPLHGKPDTYSTALIRGRSGTKVTLTVMRGHKRTNVTLSRATVVTPIVASARKTVDGKKLAIISLAAFDPGAHADVASAIRRRLKQGAQGIVFDLRGNGGGLVTEARLIASLFLRDGTIVTTRGRDVATQVLSATGNPIAPKIPLVVLVDRNTASASEIVTGALKDRKRATVVGTNTFGKGVFQELIEMPNGGALDITAGQYFTPNGTNLGAGGVKTGAGIVPNVRAQDDPKTTRDEALDRALAVLAAKTR
jgi:carboxyl-terminal processing protease